MIVATLVAGHPRRRRLVMSPDKDFYQLLGPDVSVLNTARRTDQRMVGPDEVRLRYHGVGPDQGATSERLTGDPSDRILWDRGVGAVGTTRPLADGAHLKYLDRLRRLTGRTGAAVHAVWDDVLLWRSVMRLETDVPVPMAEFGPPVVLPAAPEVVGNGRSSGRAVLSGLGRSCGAAGPVRRTGRGRAARTCSCRAAGRSTWATAGWPAGGRRAPRGGPPSARSSAR